MVPAEMGLCQFLLMFGYQKITHLVTVNYILQQHECALSPCQIWLGNHAVAIITPSSSEGICVGYTVCVLAFVLYIDNHSVPLRDRQILGSGGL